MSKKYIIECPHCYMRFFVQDYLLAAANGMLRCGHCSKIFDGSANVIGDAESPVSPVVESAAIEQETDEVVNKAADAHVDEFSEEHWEEVVNTFSRFSFSDTAIVKTDHSIITKKDIVQLPLIPENGVEVSLEEPVHIDEDINKHLDAIDLNHFLQLDEGILLSLQNRDVDMVIRESKAASSIVSPIEPETDVKRYDVVFDEDDIADEQAPQVDQLKISPLQRNNTQDIYGNQLVKVGTADFTTLPPVVNKLNKRIFLWGGVCCLMLLVLAGQYFRYKAPILAASEENRPWAETICRYLWCELPIKIDVEKIRTERLVMRRNPEYENVLNLDCIIYNDAEFSQPYPIIELSFTNLNGEVVTSRRFTPNEYLTSDVFKKNLMPSKMPIYLSFEMIDPGDDATGYALHYYPSVKP